MEPMLRTIMRDAVQSEAAQARQTAAASINIASSIASGPPRNERADDTGFWRQVQLPGFLRSKNFWAAIVGGSLGALAAQSKAHNRKQHKRP